MTGKHENKHRSTPASCHTAISVTKCQCGAYHLRYRYFEIAVRKEALYLLMEACYQHEATVERAKKDGYQHPDPMQFSLGVVMVTIPEDDFVAFSKAVGDAVSQDMGIMTLLSDHGTNNALS